MERSRKLNTIVENHLFSRLYSKGKRCAGQFLIVYYIKNRKDDEKRIGITVSKSRGKAVVRNRIKRLIRESLRQVWHNVKDGYLIVVVARQPAAEASFEDISDELSLLLKRAALLDGQT